MALAIVVLTDWTFGKEQYVLQIFMLFTTFFIASLQYKYLEAPINKSSLSLVNTAKIGVALLVVCVAIIAIYIGAKNISKDHNNAIAYQSGIEVVTYGKNEALNTCNPQHFSNEPARDLERCLKRTTEKKHIFILGDSHGQQIKQAFVSAFDDFEVKQIHFGTIADILNGKRADDFEYTLGQIKKGDFVVVKFFRLKFYERGIWHVSTDKNPLTLQVCLKK